MEDGEESRLLEDKSLELKDLEEAADEFSSHISSQIRNIGIGIIAAIWAVLNSDKVTLDSTILCVSSNRWLQMAFFAIVLALLIDFTQYLAAYFNAEKCRDTLEVSISEGGPDRFLYDPESYLYKCRKYAFYAKIAVAFLALVFLLLSILSLDFK